VFRNLIFIEMPDEQVLGSHWVSCTYWKSIQMPPFLWENHSNKVRSRIRRIGCKCWL